ncbi:hypothetical protein [Psychrobacillus lasiicapitis]|uniref:Uncharacterized protein n=1 Tax=Psychrobacillus lasiicapitis TaxID=1636719 RepID=A0A544TAN7_9BACI|nr:hypothetical protein [Psychrobacillus lasiicapitis]TQR14418.1 hypothetical protein FG382_08150 [Psychrobacillus lasiicapitis]GGA31509.1 hypothetical protein GCM10011384_21290 [Psychrobacillus lasiicapitis]
MANNANTSEHWIWKFDQWVIDTEKEYIYKPLGEKIANNLGEGLKDIGLIVWNSFVETLPDLIGFGTIAAGAFVIISTMFGRGMIKPLAIFGGVTILAAVILEAN